MQVRQRSGFPGCFFDGAYMCFSAGRNCEWLNIIEKYLFQSIHLDIYTYSIIDTICRRPEKTLQKE